MDLDELRTLLALLHDHDVREFRLKDDTRTVEVKLGAEPVAPPPASWAPMPAPPAVAAPVAASAAAEAAPADDGVVVKAPVVGTFYVAPSPGAAPFVEVGQRVEKGQVLCIIEAMKLMNEIEAETAGTVVARLAQDGHPVEYNQPMFRIRPG